MPAVARPSSGGRLIARRASGTGRSGGDHFPYPKPPGLGRDAHHDSTPHNAASTSVAAAVVLQASADVAKETRILSFPEPHVTCVNFFSLCLRPRPIPPQYEVHSKGSAISLYLPGHEINKGADNRSRSAVVEPAH